MKKTILLFASLAITLISCKQSQKGNIDLENGEGKKVPVKYEIAAFKYDDFITKVSKDEFTKITEQASSEAKLTCKFMPTYEPKELTYNISNDTVSVVVIFHAKNAMGVPGSSMSVSKFVAGNLVKDNNIIDMEERAKQVADSIANALEAALK